MLSTVCATSFAASLVETVAQCDASCWTGGVTPLFARAGSNGTVVATDFSYLVFVVKKTQENTFVNANIGNTM